MHRFPWTLLCSHLACTCQKHNYWPNHETQDERMVDNKNNKEDKTRLQGFYLYANISGFTVFNMYIFMFYIYMYVCMCMLCKCVCINTYICVCVYTIKRRIASQFGNCFKPDWTHGGVTLIQCRGKSLPSSLRLWAALVISLVPPCSWPCSLLLKYKMRMILRRRSQATWDGEKQAEKRGMNGHEILISNLSVRLT